MKTIFRLALVAVASFALTSCDAKCDKFNAKEYAQHKTERLDQVVNLTDAQQKEVYALYLEQGKEIAGHIKALKKVECDKPACDKKDCTKKADCKKATCDKKADCNKAECTKKAECKKADCKKAECDKKAACDKKDCTKKAECKKATCDKKDCKKAECTKKAECKKVECDKKAACDKKDCKKAECDKNRRPHHRPMVNPEAFKAHIKKLAAILTPEQMELLKASKAKRFECAPKAGECCPTAEPCANK